MRFLICLFLLINCAWADTEWIYYQVDEGDTIESIGRNINGNENAFKNKHYLKKLPAPGKHFRFPKDLARLTCNIDYLPRYIKLDYRLVEVQLATPRYKFAKKEDFLNFVKKNPHCLKNFRPWRKLQFISYVVSRDSLEEENVDISTQSNITSYAGLEYFRRQELGWVKSWITSFRGRLVKGESAKGYSLGPSIDLEAGIGKALEVNKQTAYVKLWRNQFDFVGDTNAFIKRHTNTSYLLGGAYEYIWSRNARPWMAELGAYYDLKSSFMPKVDGKTEELGGYALRLSLRFPIVFEKYDKIYLQPSWQYMNFTAPDYSLTANQFSLLVGFRF